MNTVAKPFSIRLDEQERAALARAAKAEARTTSSLVRKIITDWLRKQAGKR